MPYLEPDPQLIEEKLKKLSPDDQPIWGNMTPQHMVEHLIQTTRMSAGKDEYEVHTSEDKLKKFQEFLFSDHPMPKEFQSSYMPKGMPDLKHEDLDTAIQDLIEELEDYERIYLDDPDKKAPHPLFGHLGRDGWHQLHRKHYTHHLAQFGLVEDPEKKLAQSE